MISNLKKNKIDLFQLKSLNDLENVEQHFDKFLKKLFKNKNKYFTKNNTCACGQKKIKKKKKLNFFVYNKCECGTYFINPMPTSETLKLIYSEKGPYSLYRKKFFENKSKKNIRNGKVNYRKAFQLLTFIKDKKKSKILDFGCGDGDFLKICKKFGFKNLIGIDPKYQKKQNIDKILFLNSLEQLNKSMKFDCVTLWGVLEHVKDPFSLIKKILSFLNHNGFIVMETPNANSLLMNHIIENEKREKPIRFIEPGRHLFFFFKIFFFFIGK